MHNDHGQCPICSDKLMSEHDFFDRDAARYVCARCGTYDMTESAAVVLPQRLTNPRQVAALSYAVRSLGNNGDPPLLTSFELDDLITTRLPTPDQLLDNLIRAVGVASSGHGAWVPLNAETDSALIGAQDRRAVEFVLAQAVADGLLIGGTEMSADKQVQLTMAGWQRISGLAAEQPPARAGPSETGWPRVDRTGHKIRVKLAEGEDAEDYQGVGLLCRDALISLAQEAFDLKRHVTDGQDPPSETDAKRMLDAFIAVELGGSSNEETRKHAKAALTLANAVTHKRTATYRDAALCAEATLSIINIVAIVSGRIGPS